MQAPRADRLFQSNVLRKQLARSLRREVEGQAEGFEHFQANDCVAVFIQEAVQMELLR